jgi:hypothetical protein
MDAYGDSLEADAWDLATRIQGLVESKGAGLDLSLAKLSRQIMKFVQMRQWYGFNDITGPGHRSFRPPGWNAHRERALQDWIQRTFTLDIWQEAVLGPVFGTDERYWEARCNGWREEMLLYLPAWIQRSVSLADAVDLTPLELEVQDDYVDPRNAKIDPYLLERGGGGKFKKRSGPVW